MAEKFRVTYATLTADNEDMHVAYEAGIETARGWLGAEIAAPGDDSPGDPVEVTSPADPAVVIARVRAASPAAIEKAMEDARAAAPEWAGRSWQDRMAVIRKVGDLISEYSNELAALVTMEVGKNRLEALGDVEEAAVFFRYYADQMEANEGYDRPMDSLTAAEKTRSVLKPHGVWAVIAPFNFPAALAAGPAAAALLTGNTVVLKPSVQGSHTAWRIYQILLKAGVPEGAVQFLPGGDEVGKAVVGHREVDGITFTGSYAVGMSILRDSTAAGYPKPVVAEMGGKNPTIVAASADLDKAAQGVARSAFGFSGQKCSACSRVYVDASVHDEFLAKLAAKAEEVTPADPLERDTFMGPVIDADAVARFEKAVNHARESGRVVAGGEVLQGTDGFPGHYVQATVVGNLRSDDWLFAEELFVPFVAVTAVDSLDEAMARANETPLGLTAGFFSGDDAEIDWFLDTIHAGVVYVNRPAGATTGAWPGVQPFGGWKGSGSSGKAGGGLYYLGLYLREQSQSVVS
ncbi:aldehyde dehydrogenase family protein [Ornithinicoccus hortensis]|uniref:L-glutamate gamma-semialdehyde dehydrogenase n=1 Tax=Ornithinicoccus hortensis TaxID=82346 RepID=A0A542YVV8_9MICO|nr:1-pyrroline-5-carboxylate dehydrogenase [Ornithinicoccus hortensis]